MRDAIIFFDLLSSLLHPVARPVFPTQGVWTAFERIASRLLLERPHMFTWQTGRWIFFFFINPFVEGWCVTVVGYVDALG